MKMSNRVLGSAIVAALAQPAIGSFEAFKRSVREATESLGISGSNDAPRPPRSRVGGWSAAEGKRRARKRRNQLRAKGHFKQAVR